MSYVNDKLYNGYLRRKMAVIVSKVKATDIVPHLPCLTFTDREEIEAKKTNSGNYIAMQLLIDCLRKRENWPEEFISALEECQHPTIAEEIRAEYNSLRGQSSPKPPSPAATVVQAHVHPAPTADQSLSLLESAGDGPAAVAPPAQVAAPPEPVAKASPPPEAPVLPESSPSPGPEAAKAAPSTDLDPQPPQSPQATVSPHQATPRPSPQTPHQQATTPPPHTESPVHQEPEEHSESDLLAVPSDADVIPEETTAVDSEVSEINDEVTPEPDAPVLQPEMAAPCQPDPTVQTEILEVSPPQSPAPTQIDPAETPESISTTMTPEKPPVQDTTPPADKVTTTTLVPEEICEPIAIQVTENSQHTETMGTTSPPLDGTDGPCTSLRDDDDDDDDDACLSKPTRLLSIQQNNETHPPASEDEPCSANTGRLEFSDSTKDSEPASQVTVAVACSGLASDPETTASPSPCQENGVVEEPVSFPHNEPEENHYESPCQSSMGEQEVLVHVVHVTEEPPIQNLDGQTLSMLDNDIKMSDHPSLEKYARQPQIVVESPSSVSPESSCHSCEDQTEEVSQGEACMSEEPQAQILNGQAASALNKEPDSATPTSAVTVSIVNAPTSENCHPSEPGAVEALLELKPQGQQDPKKEAPASSTSSNTKYLLTAAGVGACALFVAWKLKN